MIKELITAEGMLVAEGSIIAQGTSLQTLMNRAGKSVFEVINETFKPAPVTILCGPGKNGSDAQITAMLLDKAGWPVTLFKFQDLDKIEEVELSLESAALIVDGLFGTGLTRPIEGDPRRLIEFINQLKKPVVSIDIPSGIETNSGACLGEAIKATITVTFGRARPGHYLLPGRLYAGEVIVKDIGIPDELYLPITVVLNSPELWLNEIKEPLPTDHKYSRGGCLVVSSDGMPGALRLASKAARRAGAGIVRLICKSNDYPLFASSVWGDIVTPLTSAEDYLKWAMDEHYKALLWGVGSLPTQSTREQALLLLSTKKPLVLDGGALSSFEGEAQLLTSHLHEKVILTPHDGEFARLFPHLAFLNNRTEKAHKAALESGCVIVLKGYDTVIAAPDGYIIINDNAPPTLSTAGTGDVLAGIMAGLLAQGLSPQYAAAAAVWIHGEAANRVGLGLIVEDLLPEIPHVLQHLHELKKQQ